MKKYNGEICRPMFCRLCGGAVQRGDFAMKFYEKVVCDSCISEISAREILRICEFTSKEELLYNLGFTAV